MSSFLKDTLPSNSNSEQKKAAAEAKLRRASKCIADFATFLQVHDCETRDKEGVRIWKGNFKKETTTIDGASEFTFVIRIKVEGKNILTWTGEMIAREGSLLKLSQSNSYRISVGTFYGKESAFVTRKRDTIEREESSIVPEDTVQQAARPAIDQDIRDIFGRE